MEKIIGWLRSRVGAMRRRRIPYELLVDYQLVEDLVEEGNLLLVDLGLEAGPNNIAVVEELQEETENMAAMRELSHALDGAADAALQARGALSEALAEVERLQRELAESRRSQAAAEEERGIWQERFEEVAEQMAIAIDQLEQAELPAVPEELVDQDEEEEEQLDDTLPVEEVLGEEEEESVFWDSEE
jgi:chromosome segregation ATPase